VFCEVGFEAATFSAIASRANLSRPAINHSFKSKRELYRAVVETTDASVAAGIQKGREATTLLGQLSAFVRAAAQVDAEDRSPAAFRRRQRCERSR
jgi:AcrR family transcriptional regulator